MNVRRAALAFGHAAHLDAAEEPLQTLVGTAYGG